jgi:hypothetical protein
MSGNRTYPPFPPGFVPAGGSPGGAAPGTTQGGTYYPSAVPGGGGAASSGSQAGSAGAVPTVNRQDFIKNYANMVARTWTDDSYLQLILSNAADTLAGSGMPTVPGAVIRVIQHQITGSGKIEDQVDAWVEGNRTGLYDLFLPMKPDQFDVTPGSGAPGGDACAGGGCCCCPCCCCT